MLEFLPIASSSKGNCYVITDGGSKILLECGIPFKKIQQALHFKTSSLAAVLITHSHLDHSRAAKDLAWAGLDVYTSQPTLDALGLKGHRFHAISARHQFWIGTWGVMPFETVHEGEKGDTLGFLLGNGTERFLFLTDTCYCPVRFYGLTMIAIECNYSGDILAENVKAGDVHPALRRRIARSHMSLETVKEMLLANDLSQVREIWLLHLSSGNSDELRFKNEIQEVTGKPVMVA